MKKLHFRIMNSLTDQLDQMEQLDHLFHVYHQVVTQFLDRGKVTDNYPLWILEEASKYCAFLERNQKKSISKEDMICTISKGVYQIDLENRILYLPNPKSTSRHSYIIQVQNSVPKHYELGDLYLVLKRNGYHGMIACHEEENKN